MRALYVYKNKASVRINSRVELVSECRGRRGSCQLLVWVLQFSGGVFFFFVLLAAFLNYLEGLFPHSLFFCFPASESCLFLLFSWVLLLLLVPPVWVSVPSLAVCRWSRSWPSSMRMWHLIVFRSTACLILGYSMFWLFPFEESSEHISWSLVTLIFLCFILWLSIIRGISEEPGDITAVKELMLPTVFFFSHYCT